MNDSLFTWSIILFHRTILDTKGLELTKVRAPVFRSLLHSGIIQQKHRKSKQCKALEG